MMLRALFVASLLCLAPSLASAQSDDDHRPGFGASIALHVSAVVSSVLATGTLAGATVIGLSCSFGGTSSDCAATTALAITAAVLGVAGLALGIAASVVHGNTHAARAQSSSVSFVPLVWGDATGGGAGFTLRL